MTFQAVELQTMSTDLLIVHRISGGQHMATGYNAAIIAFGSRTWFDNLSTIGLTISYDQSQRAEGVGL